jgi:hypothetical protein
MSTPDQKQWRKENAQLLRGARLQFRRYARPSETWDHDHCAACWAKFAEFDEPDVQHEGYTTCDDYKRGTGYDRVWVDCFNDLKDDLGWTLIS